MTCLGSVGDMLQQGTAGTTRRIGVPVFLVDRVWAVGLVEFFHTLVARGRSFLPVGRSFLPVGSSFLPVGTVAVFYQF